jgi:hypothetical protein
MERVLRRVLLKGEKDIMDRLSRCKIPLKLKYLRSR